MKDDTKPRNNPLPCEEAAAKRLENFQLDCCVLDPDLKKKLEASCENLMQKVAHWGPATARPDRHTNDDESLNKAYMEFRPACCYFLGDQCTYQFCTFWHPPAPFDSKKLICKFGRHCQHGHGGKVSSLEFSRIFAGYFLFSAAGDNTSIDKIRSRVEKFLINHSVSPPLAHQAVSSVLFRMFAVPFNYLHQSEDAEAKKALARLNPRTKLGLSKLNHILPLFKLSPVERFGGINFLNESQSGGSKALQTPSSPWMKGGQKPEKKLDQESKEDQFPALTFKPKSQPTRVRKPEGAWKTRAEVSDATTKRGSGSVISAEADSCKTEDESPRIERKESIPCPPSFPPPQLLSPLVVGPSAAPARRHSKQTIDALALEKKSTPKDDELMDLLLKIWYDRMTDGALVRGEPYSLLTEVYRNRLHEIHRAEQANWDWRNPIAALRNKRYCAVMSSTNGPELKPDGWNSLEREASWASWLLNDQ